MDANASGGGRRGPTVIFFSATQHSGPGDVVFRRREFRAPEGSLGHDLPPDTIDGSRERQWGGWMGGDPELTPRGRHSGRAGGERKQLLARAGCVWVSGWWAYRAPEERREQCSVEPVPQGGVGIVRLWIVAQKGEGGGRCGPAGEPKHLSVLWKGHWLTCWQMCAGNKIP